MKPSILFVDDDPHLIAGLRRLLRPHRAHWHMTFTTNARVASTWVRHLPFDVVVTDLLMPGKEGLEFIMELRRDVPHLAIIAISGGARKGYLNLLEMARALGASRTLQKPFRPQALVAALEAVLAPLHDGLPGPRTRGGRSHGAA
jgi:CheY-like chemotaxis protein